MTLQQADQIRQDWGKFLEITNGRLMSYFMAKIPKSFLPYEKEIIEEALNLLIDYCNKNGNIEAVKSINNTIPFLSIYIDDDEAILEISKNFSNEKYLSTIKKHFGDGQKEQYKYIIENF